MPTLYLDDERFDITAEEVEEVKRLVREARTSGSWEWTITDDDGDKTWLAVPTSVFVRVTDW